MATFQWQTLSMNLGSWLRGFNRNTGSSGEDRVQEDFAPGIAHFVSPPAGAGLNLGFWSHGLTPEAIDFHPLWGFRKCRTAYGLCPSLLPGQPSIRNGHRSASFPQLL